MAKISIPCLVGKTNKAGITSWYWQPSKTLRDAGWKPVSIGKAAGKHPTPEIVTAAERRNAEVQQWKDGGATPVQVRKREAAGTLAALIARYRKEIINGKKPGGEPHLARSTARTYQSSLKRLEEWAGKQPLAYITPARVKVLRDGMLATVGHHAAHQALKMGRTLFKFAIDCDLLPPGANPFTNFGLAPPSARRVIWSPPAREAMIETAYDLGQPSMALAIMLGFAIGQREQDLLGLVTRHYVPVPEHKMQPEDYAFLAKLAPDGIPRGIRLRQQKTKAWIEVPVVGMVRWAIEANVATAAAGGSVSILLDDTRSTADRAALYAGAAGQTRFQRDFAEIREWAIARVLFEGDEDLAAEIETLQFRDLRRTCVVYLGELGMDAHLIAGVTGHDIDETQAILKTYMPRTTGRAARAIALAAARQTKQDVDRAEKAG